MRIKFDDGTSVDIRRAESRILLTTANEHSLIVGQIEIPAEPKAVAVFCGTVLGQL